MERYLNLSGRSGIEGFEIGIDYVTVKFKNTPTKTYTYSYDSAGQHHIEQMKVLARNGSGLNSYIMKNVKDKYVK